MTVGSLSTRLWAALARSRPRCPALVCVLFASAFAFSNARAQNAAAIAIGNDTPHTTDGYPVGNAVDVYKAVLDLIYVDGKDQPKVVVMWDSVMMQGGGPCAFGQCKDRWVHKSKIDTAAVLAFARQSGKRAKLVDFGYRIPILYASNDDFEQIRQNGYALLAAQHANQVGPVEAFWTGFRQTYPGAWSYVALSKVGFNRDYSQALLSVFQVCGEDCRSNEIIFLKRNGDQWRVIERVADYTQTNQTSGNLRYRGPIPVNKDSTQVVALDASEPKARSESADAAKVYTAVFDRLYSFHGESPKRLVVLDLHPRSAGSLPTHRSVIDPATVANYSAVTQIRDAVSRFRYRIPITWVTDTTLKRIARDGSPLAKMAAKRFEEEQSPLWYGFRARYPGAWGYIALGRVAFNRAHDQALVFTSHFCGSTCVNADTWFLERHGNDWTIVERMPRESAANWSLDGTRYLGPEAKAHWYRPRRIHGVLTAMETGDPLVNQLLQVKYYTNSSYFMTDAYGRYTVNNLPLTGISLMAKCPDRFGGKWLLVAPIAVTPGLDTTFNARVDFDLCQD